MQGRVQTCQRLSTNTFGDCFGAAISSNKKQIYLPPRFLQAPSPTVVAKWGHAFKHFKTSGSETLSTTVFNHKICPKLVSDLFLFACFSDVLITDFNFQERTVNCRLSGITFPYMRGYQIYVRHIGAPFTKHLSHESICEHWEINNRIEQQFLTLQ